MNPLSIEQKIFANQSTIPRKTVLLRIECGLKTVKIFGRLVCVNGHKKVIKNHGCGHTKDPKSQKANGSLFVRKKICVYMLGLSRLENSRLKKIHHFDCCNSFSFTFSKRATISFSKSAAIYSLNKM